MPKPNKRKTPQSAPFATTQSPDGENRDTATALLAAQIDFDMDSTMQYDARKKLKTATDGSLEVEHLPSRSFVGNASAREFTTAWAKQDEILGRMGIIESRCDEVNQNYEQVKVELQAVQQECSFLRKAYDESMSSEEVIRQRFLSCFKRDVLKNSTSSDTNIIQKGNRMTHHGDAWRDAHLYDDGGRTDIDAFRALYGFFPSTILRHMDPSSPVMYVINRHATLYSDKDNPPSNDFHASFALFTSSYKDHEFPKEYRSDGHSLNTLHLNFLKHC